MNVSLVSESNYPDALEIYTISWRESHRGICSPEFLEKRDYNGYLRKKMGSLYLISGDHPAGIFSLDGESFGDLYIHPSMMGRGFGTACLQFAMQKSRILRLTVISSNLGAIRLYEKMGFRFTGRDIPLRNGLYEREMKYMEQNHG